MNAPLVVSYGGGVDSLAMCIALRDHGERPEAVVFSDGRRFAWRDLIDANDAQRSLFPDAPVEACTQCSDGGCEVAP